MKTENLSDSQNQLQQIILLDPIFDKIELVFPAFENRKTIKEMKEEKLPLQILSNLLWAACGVNRKVTPTGVPGRTAASASRRPGATAQLRPSATCAAATTTTIPG